MSSIGFTQRKDHIQHWIMFADVHNYCMLKTYSLQRSGVSQPNDVVGDP